MFLSDPDVTLYHGDVLETLRDLPAESVDCVVTSPPYWGLRDYGQEGQLGLEPTPEQYVERMVEVFREVRRVLAPHGTCWVNLGDSYASGEIGRHDSVQGREIDGKRVTAKATVRQQARLQTGLKSKDLVGIPWRVAFALQADGWYLRSDIIWAKPNPMPESVTDRPTKAHEYVFLLSKQPRYFFDQEAVREPHARIWNERNGGTMARANHKEAEAGRTHQGEAHRGPYPIPNPAGRNIRSVWDIATQPYPEAHFATFPEELARRCIAAGCPEQVCRALVCQKCGVPHPTANVEWLWNAEAGRYEDLPEQDAIQEALRRVRELLREQESVDVLEELREQEGEDALPVGESTEHGGAGPNQSPGLHSGLEAGSSEGGEGLRPGTSAGDGGAPGALFGTLGEGSPPERNQERQPPLEFGDRDGQNAPWGGRMPELRDALLRSLTCACGSSGFRVCGKARERITQRSEGEDQSWSQAENPTAKERHLVETGQRGGHGNLNRGDKAAYYANSAKRETLGFTDCGHSDYRPGIVLDPFMGSGTTAYVARKLGRHSIGIDLNAEYLALAARRLQQQSLFAEVV